MVFQVGTAPRAVARAQTSSPLDLAAIVLLAVVGVAAALLDAPDWVQVPLGLGLVFFAPGYAFVALLFPQRYRAAVAATPAGPGRDRQGLMPLERLATAVGLSITLVVLTGFFFVLMSVKLGASQMLGTLGVAAAVLATAAIVRRAGMPPEERFQIALWRDTSPRPALPNRGLLAALLVFSLLVVGAAVAYVAVTPRPQERFTELYVLGSDGTASCYPRLFQNGTYRAGVTERCPPAGNVTVGVVNHEGRRVDYWLRILWSNETVIEGEESEVHDVEEWQTLRFTLDPVPIDLRLGVNATPQHEVPLEVPDPPGTGTWRLSFQLFLDEAPPASLPPSAVGAGDRRIFLWVDAS
jgi:uncharacterized membrane protein